MGTAVSRNSKPYLAVSWLAKLLGGSTDCLWSVWFRAHYTHQKFQTEGPQLAMWAAEHDALMRARQAELEENGWTVTTETANNVKLEGTAAVVAGKPDLVARLADETLIIDGKTGVRRNSDICQLLIYLYLWPRCRKHQCTGTLSGEVQYKRGDERVPVRQADLTATFQANLIQLIKVTSGGTPPRRSPSRENCRFCSIGPDDCPDRFKERKGTEGAGILTSEW